SAYRFDNKRINFTFDEYVEVANVQQNLIVSPLPKQTPEVTSKLKTVTVRIKDTLEENTTYSIIFDDIIKDVNEGNAVKNFIYVFSTGDRIDSMELTGSVELAENGKIDTTLTVMLHRSGDDSAVYKERPRYIAKLDGTGSFHFRFLAPGKYYLYALQDQAGIYRYTDKSKLFAFADSAILLQGKPEPVKLFAYSVPAPEKPAAPPSSGRKAAADKRLKFQTSTTSTQDLLTDYVFQFETPLRNFDSTKIQFTTDTLYTPVRTGYSWSLDSTKKTLTFKFPWKENTRYGFIMQKDFATDTSGYQLLKADTLDFMSRKKAEYAGLKLKFRNLDMSIQPTLLLV
ncbi:MAG: hypothetical protein EOO88_62260, partial [Pedobacter sp.]